MLEHMREHAVTSRTARRPHRNSGTARRPPFTVITVWQDERKLVRREVTQNVYSLDTFFWAKSLTVLPIELAFVLLVRAPAPRARLRCRVTRALSVLWVAAQEALSVLAFASVRWSMSSLCTATSAMLKRCAYMQLSVVTYFMYGFQRDAGKFFIYFATMALAQLISESVGMLFAMLVATADLAIVLLSIVFILLLALTGFLTSETPVYYKWIEHINYLRCALRNSSTKITLHASLGSSSQPLSLRLRARVRLSTQARGSRAGMEMQPSSSTR